MPLIVKRKIAEAWREAVARRGRERGREAEVLRAYDDELAAGKHEAEAAYAALARFDALFLVPDAPVPGRPEPI
jgi:hypothetical protein